MKPILIAAFAAVAVAPAALAAAPPPPPGLKVAYADLNLREPGDAPAMLQRIRRAAASICAPDANGHAEILAADACRRQAVARAVATLDAPAVTAALHDASPSIEVAGRR